LGRQFATAILILFGITGCAGAPVGFDTYEGFQVPVRNLSPTTLSLPETLTLKTALDLAKQSPDVLASSYLVKAAAADTSQAGTAPNPKIGASTENVSLEEPAWDSVVNRLHLSQEFELGGKRSARKRLGRSREARANALHEKMLARKKLDVTIAFNEALFVQENIGIQKAIYDAAMQLYDVAAEKLENGKISRREFLQFDIALEEAKLSFENAGSELRPALARLASEIGAGQAELSVLKCEGKLGATEAISDAGEFLEVARERVMESSPVVVEAVKAVDIAIMSLERERAKRWPNLTVGVMMARNELKNDNAAGASLSLPIPIWNFNSGAVKAAALRVEAAKKEVEQVINDALARLEALGSELVSAGRNVEAYESRILPRARESHEISVAAFESGRLSYVETLEPLITLLRARKAALDWRKRFSNATAQLTELTGMEKE